MKTGKVKKVSRARRASALIAVMVLCLILAIATASILSFSTQGRREVSRVEVYQNELTAAEQAADAMIGQIRFFAANKPRQVGGPIANFHTAVKAIRPPVIPGFTLTNTNVTCTANDTLQTTVINTAGDQWNGYNMLRVDYLVHVEAHATDNVAQRFTHPGVALERVVRVQQIPLYAYAIFYANLLEICNGARMDVVGKMHTNGDLYVNAQNPLYLHNNVTSAGNFHAGIFAPNSGRTSPLQSGSPTDAGQYDVYVTTDGKSTPSSTGTMYDLKSGANYLDSQDATWVKDVTADCKGYLRDSSLGISTVGLPIPTTENPHQLIEPSNSNDPPAVQDAKFANKADITITYNAATKTATAVNASGASVPLSYTWYDPVAKKNVTKYVAQVGTILNNREGKTATTINIDMGNLIQSGDAVGGGVIYINSTTQPTGGEAAVMLSDTTKIPTNPQGGLTVATNVPLYTQGDVNTVYSGNRPVLLLAGDSVNILSNNVFKVSGNTAPNSYNSNAFAIAANNTAATVTTTNAIFLSGNVPSSGGYYSGGAENYFRYLENWGGITHTFNGSILNLYSSTVAKGTWKSSTTYYGAPTRVWSWDSSLAGITPPPGMPTFLTIMLQAWTIVTPRG